MSVIRNARDADLPAILRLLVQVNMVHHNGRPDLFRGPVTKYSEAELKEILREKSTPVFVYADETDSVLGYAFCIVKTPPNTALFTDVRTLYIDDLCVDEAARGKHVGSALLRHVEQYAREIGCYNVTLNVWSCNPGALAFYEHEGLVPQKIGMEKNL